MDRRQMPGRIRDGGPRLPRLPELRLGSRGGQALILIAIVVAVLAWLGTGVYMVGPGEEGVIRQFGQEVSRVDAGIQYHLPLPIQTVDVVNVAEIRRAEIGFKCARPGESTAPCQEVLSEALMVTGDENIINIHVVIQYKIKDSSDYLFKLRDPDQALKTATEVALRGVVGSNTIDRTMIEARGEVEAQTMEFLQQLMDSYQSGIQITAVKLQEVDAPEQVRDAFHDVVRAREDRDKLTREAQGYREDLVPKARGEKEQVIRAAEAYKEQRIIRARGDAEKFVEVLAEYQKAPEVTRIRLYLETIEKILPNTEKIIIDSKMAGSLLPFLPLRGVLSPEAASSGG